MRKLRPFSFFFPYKFQSNENAKALCLYCTDLKDTNIFVMVIQWDKLWYDFPVFTVSKYGEQAVSFKMIDLPKSLQQVLASSVLISAFLGLLWRLIARGSLLPSNMVAVQPCKVRASGESNEVLRA